MKYFSIRYWRDWDEEDPIGKSYEKYVLGIRPRLPRDLQRLSGAGGDISLNDGTIKRYVTSQADATADIDMDCQYEDGSGALGQRKVLMHYTGVRAVGSQIDPDSGSSLSEGYGDHGFDEIELLEDNLFEHRMLFASGIEIAICFQDFSLEYVDVPYAATSLETQ